MPKCDIIGVGSCFRMSESMLFEEQRMENVRIRSTWILY